MKRFFFAASIASLVLASCGSGPTDTSSGMDTNYITPAPDTTNNSLPPAIQDTNKSTSGVTMPPVTLPVSNSQPAVAAPASLTKSQPSNTATALNPEHGKPGHRCDIAVGAPLNSAPAANAAPTPNVQVTPVPATTTASAPAPTGPKPKLNPAHGQPYHDCSIKVGDPLKN